MSLCPLATFRLPQAIGDHPLSQGLGTQAMTVTLVELLRRHTGCGSAAESPRAAPRDGIAGVFAPAP